MQTICIGSWGPSNWKSRSFGDGFFLVLQWSHIACSLIPIKDLAFAVGKPYFRFTRLGFRLCISDDIAKQCVNNSHFRTKFIVPHHSNLIIILPKKISKLIWRDRQWTLRGKTVDDEIWGCNTSAKDRLLRMG